MSENDPSIALGEGDDFAIGPTPLRAMVNGQLCDTTFAVALRLGVHPDDITAAIIEDLPSELAKQAYRRAQEAAAHDGAVDVLGIIKYWAAKEHNVQLHTDRLGQVWIDEPPIALWPPTA